jgi:dihydrofolate reductase
MTLEAENGNRHMLKVILYIATSQDGYIADTDGGVDWLPGQAENVDDAFGYKALLDQVDTILMGRRSYAQILGFGDWEWPDKMTYVFSTSPLTSTQKHITFVHEDPSLFMKRHQLTKSPHDIWLLGGAMLAQSFANRGLIDECVITVMPCLLEDGIKLGVNLEGFHLTETKQFNGGITQLFYGKNPSETTSI